MEHQSRDVVGHDAEVAPGVARSGAADDVERPGVNLVSAGGVEGADRRGSGGVGLQGVAGEGHHAVLT